MSKQEEEYIYFVKALGQDVTVRLFNQDPIIPTKVKVMDDNNILYRFPNPKFKHLTSVEADKHE